MTGSNNNINKFNFVKAIGDGRSLSSVGVDGAFGLYLTSGITRFKNDQMMKVSKFINIKPVKMP